MYSQTVTKFGRLEEEPITRGESSVDLPFIVENFLRLDGRVEMKDNLNMGNNRIKNIKDPTEPQDTATKNYVDTRENNFFSRDRNDDLVINQDLNMDTKRILNLPLPVEDEEPTTKIYVDTTRDKIRREAQIYNPFIFQNGEFVAKDKINMRGFNILNVAEPVNPEDVVKLKNINEIKSFIPFSKKNGDFVSKSSLFMGKKKLGGLKEPVKEGEAANKGYVDKEIKKINDLYAEKFYDGTNYQIDADFDLKNNRIFNVPDPTSDNEVANKKYVDNKTKNRPVNNIDIEEFKKELTDNIKNNVEERVKDLETRVNNKSKNKNKAFILSSDKSKYEAKNDLDIKNFRILNVHTPLDDDEATNKEYVDDEIKELENKLEEKYNSIVKHDAFIKENGFHIATEGLNMGFKPIVNVPDPKNENDAINKNYLDKTLEKNNKKTPSIFLFNAEALGPVVGIDAIIDFYNEKFIISNIIETYKSKGVPNKFINRDTGENITLTNFYFGNYANIFDKEIKGNILFLFPFEGTIVKYSIIIKFFNGKTGSNKKIKIKIFSIDISMLNGDPNTDLFHVFPKYKTQDIIITCSDNDLVFDCGNINPLNIDVCEYIGLIFLESDPDIEKVILTLGTQININN